MPILVNPPWRHWRGNTSVVHLFATDKVVCNYTGQLSVKYVVEGSVLWETCTGTHRAHAGQFVVLNEGQTYSTFVQSKSPVEVVSVHFDQSHFASISPFCRSVHSDPQEERSHCAEFVERVYIDQGNVTSRVNPFIPVARNGEADNFWLEQRVIDLAHALISLNDGERRRMQSVQVIKRATQDEIYRRLYTARDYMHAYQHKSISMKEIADASALSQTNLYRHFSSVFHLSPHEYLTELRVSRAKKLLQTTDSPVNSVCVTCGFQSPATFSSMFKRHTGLSPRQWRSITKLEGSNKSVLDPIP